jgi:predicted flap endonuclease-1-like 5' DNA nuclease
MSYPVTAIEGIDAPTAQLLKKAGIRSAHRLLEETKSLSGRKALAAKTGIDEKRLLAFANSADRLRIKGLGKDYAELLQAAGVATVRELKYRNPKKLAEAMAAANNARKLVRQLPSESQIGTWIDRAKSLSPKISY